MSLILVSTPAELQAVRNTLSGTIAMSNNIDLSESLTWNDGEGFDPIGTNGTPFTGTFDGQFKKLINLYINRPAVDYLGLFGYVQNIGFSVQNLVITSTSDDYYVKGKTRVGAIAGVAGGKIRRCKVSSLVKCVTNNAAAGVGGIVGVGSEALSELVFSGKIDVSASTGNIGGIAGTQLAAISNCYSDGTITGVINVGGIVGKVASAAALLTKCHSYNSSLNLYGDASYTNSHVNCYQLKANPPAGISALSANDFKLITNFTGWDFDAIWRMGKDYPELQAFASGLSPTLINMICNGEY